MSMRIFQVDAFASEPFGGNPAVVCLVEAPREADWMQRVARETQAPATAFVVRAEHGFDLRWFTSAAELQLCGHGTLASAHVLWETGEVRGDQAIDFHTRGGALTARRSSETIEIELPASVDEPAAAPDGLADALGAEPIYVGRSRFDYLVELGDEAALRALRPDFQKLARVKTRGVIVTSRPTTAGVDFVSRFFAPSVGINEDHVTGSAHCCLAPFWSRRLGKARLTARQLSVRGGALSLTVDGDRVRLGGRAVTVIRGEWTAS